MKEDKMGWACSTNEGEEVCLQDIGGTPEGKRPLGRQRCRWVDNIPMNLTEIGWRGMERTDLAQDRNQ
jgi:hypothetical protein